MKGFYSFGLAIVSSLACSATAVGQQANANSEQAVYFIDALPTATARVFETLQKETTDREVAFVDTPLGEVVALLSDDSGIPMHINSMALADFGIDVDEPITFELSNSSLEVVLNHILEPLELTYIVSGGVLVVTTEEDAASRLFTAIYPVADLVQGDHYETLVGAITATIGRDTWSKHGNGTGQIHAFAPRGSLIISQTQAVHSEIKRLLEALRQAPAGAHTAATEPQRRNAGEYGGGFGAEHGGEFGGRGGFGGEYGGGFGAEYGGRFSGRGEYGGEFGGQSAGYGETPRRGGRGSFQAPGNKPKRDAGSAAEPKPRSKSNPTDDDPFGF